MRTRYKYEYHLFEKDRFPVTQGACFNRQIVERNDTMQYNALICTPNSYDIYDKYQAIFKIEVT